MKWRILVLALLALWLIYIVRSRQTMTEAKARVIAEQTLAEYCKEKNLAREGFGDPKIQPGKDANTWVFDYESKSDQKDLLDVHQVHVVVSPRGGNVFSRATD